jgi:hypothetical protein
LPHHRRQKQSGSPGKLHQMISERRKPLAVTFGAADLKRDVLLGGGAAQEN